MKVRFYELAIGASFEFLGRQFQKSAMSMAQDEQRCGNVFRAEAEVLSDGPFLPAEEALRWKPSERPWYESIPLRALPPTSSPSTERSQ